MPIPSREVRLGGLLCAAPNGGRPLQAPEDSSQVLKLQLEATPQKLVRTRPDLGVEKGLVQGLQVKSSVTERQPLI